LLHDNLQQLLVAAKFRTDLIMRKSPDQALKDSAHEVLDILDQSIASSRSLTMELAPPVLHESGLLPGMQWLAEWIEKQHGMTVDVSGTVPATAMSEDQSIFLFRAVKELLFNVVKHATVKEARVTMEPTNDGLRVTVADSGKGFDATSALAKPRSFGLFHIRERLTMLGGHMAITSTPGYGTTVDIYIPLHGSTSTS
jgi:signal transduction histidine kinase